MAHQDKKTAPDWERIELDYRAGVLSLREIAEKHGGVNHVAISRKAKTAGWERDLSQKIKNKADALVTKQAVTADVTAKRLVTESAVVEANAQAIADIRMAHRGDIRTARSLVMRLFSQLDVTTSSTELFEQLGELLRNEDDKGQDKRNDLYQKVIELPSRIKGVKDLSDALKTLVGLEREAYSIGVEHHPNDTTLQPPVFNIVGVKPNVSGTES